ncbi:hypothetical protein [Amycolatopsis sp. NPDC059657]|uniref:hypothetical protein n=1 Tax=Amycolatopsis sp. NPDC059657 TaxID=3346899 RepID=UPI00366E4B54
MIVSRWPDLPVLGTVELPRLAGGVDTFLWPGLMTLAAHLPPAHVVIGGVMVHLHGAVAGSTPPRVTSDVDVLFDLAIAPECLRDAVDALKGLAYKVDPASPEGATHRYHGPAGETVDILAPAGLKPKPDLTTTPPGRTIEVFGGQRALRNRVLVEVHYEDRGALVPIPDLHHAIGIKCCAFQDEKRQRPARSFTSRHLQDIAFLTSLLEDPEEFEVRTSGQLDDLLKAASPLDDREHSAWRTVTDPASAHFMWETLRQR